MRALFSVLATLFALTTSAQAGQVWLTMDQVHPYKLERPALDIAVGNPAVADVTVQDTQNLLLFGKSPGLTNIYVFDDAGEVIENIVIRVRSQNSDMLTVHKGVFRTTYNCTSSCEPVITVGDEPDLFDEISSQVKKKATQAENATKGN
ncbi:MAG: hypothetical protein GXP06_00590 [Alphaproteobacteria bacterium]|nr:hypothetical protein [Alphaproteobacteria bacterium]